MENIVLKNANKIVEISPLGAELKSLKSNGKEFLWQGDKATWNGQAPILFPVCGKLKDLKFIYDGKTYDLVAHGFARKSLFSVVESTVNSVTFLLKSNAETLSCYPFEFELYVTYTLTDKLEIKYSVKNVGNGTMYFCIGSHEGYIAEGDISDYVIEFEKQEDFVNIAHNLNGLLTGEKNAIGKGNVLQLEDKYFVDDFTIILQNVNSKSVTLVGKNNGLKIKLDFDGFKHLLVWKAYNGKFVCVEPWTALPDSVDCNNQLKDKPDIIQLGVGEVKNFTHKITF